LCLESAKKQLGSSQSTANKNNHGVNKRSKGSVPSFVNSNSRRTDDEDEDYDDDDMELHKREKAAEQKKWESILKAQVFSNACLLLWHV